jgi:signal transduction histidine kinase/CheY-like chemotaxis protein/ABC-type amino acid transport substrate-binding protein
MFIAVSGCTKDSRPVESASQSPFASFRDIPGVTAEEIAAIELLQKEYSSFIFGGNLSTEVFLKENGEVGESAIVGGYITLFCEWLTGLFDIRFQPEVYTWNNLIEGLNNRTVDFMGNLTATEERLKNYYMTDPIAERQIKMMRLKGSPSIAGIKQERPPRYALLRSSNIRNLVAAVADAYETVDVNNIDEAYEELLNGRADAYIGGSDTVDFFPVADVYTESFLPLIFTPVSMTTANPALKSVISVVNKALRSGAIHHLNYLNNLGFEEFKKEKFLLQLTEDEKAYLKNKYTIPLAARYFNYPIDFYNTYEKKWEGIAFDVLQEVEKFTGLTFKVFNDEHTEFPVLLEMLYDGRAYMISDLVFSREREGRYIWSNYPLINDQYALLSKWTYPNVSINEISNARVGLISNTAHAEMFRTWFPGATDITQYNSADEAFLALGHGEVDLLMAGKTKLLSLHNYYALSDYKVNYLFNYTYESTFGFNKDQMILCSILDKAFDFTNTYEIVEQWMTKTYDTRAKLAEARLPWLIGVSVLFLCLVILMFLLLRRQFSRGKRLENLIKRRTKDLNRQNSMMSTVNAAAAVLLEPDADFDTINYSMEMICESAGLDRVYLWQNICKDDGKLYYKQLCKWTRPEYNMGDKFNEFAYEDTLPSWHILLFENKILNGPLNTLPGDERKALLAHKVNSILILPLFLKGEMWGFVSFEDCHNQRFFPQTDEYTLRSWGLLLVGAFQRYEIMRDLRTAIGEAKNASASKSRFVANMSHEMRTPMNVIVGLTDLMLEETTVSDNTKETLKKINVAGNTLMGLINDVLDISKIEAGKLELFPVQYDVANLLNDIITLNIIRTENKPITFKLDISDDLPSKICGDDLRVKQIMNNLLSNAFKYTKEGTVTLGVNCWRENVTGIDVVWVYFYVRDTGIGIREEDRKKLFTDYNQLDAYANRAIEGTGLGLSITKKFIEMMDGKIKVESEYGKGSTFSVRIRQEFVSDTLIDKETVESLRNFSYSEKKKFTRGKLVRSDLSYARVLVVDDFPVNLEVAAGMLRKYKMQVDCVLSGQEAIDIISAGEPVYNAVFMDHMMPVLDGIQTTIVIRTLRTKYAEEIPIIALTANAIAGNEQMFLDNGFNAYLSKPFNAVNLDKIVERWVRDKNRE